MATAPHEVTYLTGYRCWYEPLMLDWMARPGGTDERLMYSAAIVSADGRVILIAGAVFAPDALDAYADVELCLYGSVEADDAVSERPSLGALGPVRDAQRSASSDFPAAVARGLREVGAANGRIGLDGNGLSPGMRHSLAAALPAAELRECRQLLRLARAVKTDAEIKLLAHCAAINESSLLAAAARASAGERIGALRTAYHCSIAAAEAEFDHFSPGVGGIGFATGYSYQLSTSDVLVVDSGCLLRGYFSDTQLTASVQELDDALAARYELLRSCVLDVGAKALRPGARASEPHRAMTAFLEDTGVRAAAGGHGLGLELRDYPILAAPTGLPLRDECVELGSDLVLEPGMVVNVEATLFLPGVAALGCEVSHVITDAGARPLTEQSRETPVVAGS